MYLSCVQARESGIFFCFAVVQEVKREVMWLGLSPGTSPSLATGTGEIWASQGLLQSGITPAKDSSSQGLLMPGIPPVRDYSSQEFLQSGITPVRG